MTTRKIQNTTVSDIFLVDFGNQKVEAAGGDDIHTFVDEEYAIDASTQLFTLISSGDLIVLDVDDVAITDVLDAWKYLTDHKDALPLSELGDKLAVHPSTKPTDPNKEFYLVWTGCGDDTVNHVVGEGDLLAFGMTVGTATVSKEVRFDPQFGDVYIHEGYAKWHNGGPGDYMSAMIMTDPTVLQQAANLDLVVENDWVKYSVSGPGTGTHGFAATPVLVKRTFSLDGDWNYDGVNLTPNFSGDGLYKISSIERTVHKYINRIPLCFTSNSYTRLTSDETAWLPPGYFIKVTAYNNSDTDWNCAFMFEVYREMTA